MTRTERLLRLARQRGDLLAVATIEGPPCKHRWSRGPYPQPSQCTRCGEFMTWSQWRRRRTARRFAAAVPPDWTEAELREAWGR